MAQNDRSGRLTVSPLYYLLQMLWAVLRTVLMVCLSFVILYPFLLCCFSVRLYFCHAFYLLPFS